MKIKMFLYHLEQVTHLSSLHLTASKVNTEELVTNINFKFNKTIDLKELEIILQVVL